MGRRKKPEYTGRCIVMHGRSMMSLVIAHSLGKRGIEVIGCDDAEFTVLSFSRYVKTNFVHPRFDQTPDRFIDDLVEKVKKHRPTDDRPYVLMPVFWETDLIARFRSRFEPYVTVAAPMYDSITRVHPKDHLAETAKELGVAVPRTWHPRDEADFDALLPELRFPVMVKPTDGTGGRGIDRGDTHDQTRRLLRRAWTEQNRFPLVQEFAPGDDYCLTVLFENGVLKASMAYRNIHRFPAESGAGSMRETVTDTALTRIAVELLGPLNWNGIAELDFRWDGRAESTPLLLEVNTRFWAGLFQSVDSGVDFPWLLYSLAVNGTVESPVPRAIGRKTKTPGLWMLSAVRDVVTTEKDYERLRISWQEVVARIKDKDLRTAFATIAQSTEKKRSLRETLSALRRVFAEARSARNDTFFRDDPFVVFGVMYILGSLIRHRRLPPEFKSR